jgi:hypothetical protein
MTSHSSGEICDRLLESALQSAESASSLIVTNTEQETNRRATAAQVAELLKQAVAVWHGKFNPVSEEPETPAECPTVPTDRITISVGQSEEMIRRVLTRP